jgi:hypothetical protein
MLSVHELRAHFQWAEEAILLCPDAAADPISSFQDANLHRPLSKHARRGQPGCARSDDQHLDVA